MTQIIQRYNSKKKSTKFKSADHAKKAREAEKYQQELYKKWNISAQKKAPSKKDFVPNYTHRDSDNHIPSVSFTAGTCSRKADKQYTGTLIVGISTLHKSNAVPIISQEDAKEHASMRR